MMKDRVFMITQLDAKTYALPRRIFLLQNDEKFVDNFTKIWIDKTIKHTFTSTKEVYYD